MFKDEADRQAAIQHLPTLKDHPAWKYLERALADNVAHFNDEIREALRSRKGTMDEAGYLQDRIDDIEDFLTLPETLLKAAQDVLPETADPDEEVYDAPPKPPEDKK